MAYVKMENGGYLRRVDELGRITIPNKIRLEMDIKPRDMFLMYCDGKYVTMEKHNEEGYLIKNAEALMNDVRASAEDERRSEKNQRDMMEIAELLEKACRKLWEVEKIR